MLGKILDFICTRLRSTEIALDSLSLVQYDFCRTKTRANKIPYFTKHCRISYHYWICIKRIKNIIWDNIQDFSIKSYFHTYMYQNRLADKKNDLIQKF